MTMTDPLVWAPRASGGKCRDCGMPLGRRMLADRTLFFHINVDYDAYHRRKFGTWEQGTLKPQEGK